MVSKKEVIRAVQITTSDFLMWLGWQLHWVTVWLINVADRHPSSWPVKGISRVAMFLCNAGNKLWYKANGF